MRLTITDVAASIQRQYGGEIIPPWKMRRVIDDLDSCNAIDIQRVGVYRTIGVDDVQIVADELRRLGWLNGEAVSCS